MKYNTVALVFTLTVVTAQVVWGGEGDLFSKVRVDSVFASPSAPTAPRSPGGATVASSEQLSALLRGAGFQPRETGQQGVLVTYRDDAGQFLVAVTLSGDSRQVLLALRLADLDNSTQLTNDRLLRMMSEGRRIAPRYFAYDTDNRRLELIEGIENTRVTGPILRERIRQLAAVARQSESLWKVNRRGNSGKTDERPAVGSATAPTSANRGTTPPNGTANSAANSLVGRWSATRSATEAFALQINANGTFALVLIKGGSTTRSSGRFTLQGATFALRGSNLTLSGTIRRTSANQFEFRPGQSSKPIVFNRAT